MRIRKSTASTPLSAADERYFSGINIGNVVDDVRLLSIDVKTLTKLLKLEL